MKFPTEITTYCPKCNKHTKHKVKTPSRGRSRPLAWGNRQHERKIMGYVGKVAGEKAVKKQGKRIRLVFECQTCKKKHVRTMGTRTRSKAEIK